MYISFTGRASRSDGARSSEIAANRSFRSTNMMTPDWALVDPDEASPVILNGYALMMIESRADHQVSCSSESYIQRRNVLVLMQGVLADVRFAGVMIALFSPSTQQSKVGWPDF